MRMSLNKTLVYLRSKVLLKSPPYDYMQKGKNAVERKYRDFYLRTVIKYHEFSHLLMLIENTTAKLKAVHI